MTLTYSELKQAIQDYAAYTETSFVSNLPIFIRQAEDAILKRVRLNIFQKNASGAMTASNQYLAAPSDFLAPISLSIDVSSDKNFVEFKNLDFVQSYTPDPATTGMPRYYAQFDEDNFYLGPTPDLNYVADIHYYYRPASLTAGAEDGTTWLSQNAENALLYGSLVHGYIYMKGGGQSLESYKQEYVAALGELKQWGEGKEPIDEFRYGKPRVARE